MLYDEFELDEIKSINEQDKQATLQVMNTMLSSFNTLGSCHHMETPIQQFYNARILLERLDDMCYDLYGLAIDYLRKQHPDLFEKEELNYDGTYAIAALRKREFVEIDGCPLHVLTTMQYKSLENTDPILKEYIRQRLRNSKQVELYSDKIGKRVKELLHEQSNRRKKPSRICHYLETTCTSPVRKTLTPPSERILIGSHNFG